MNTECSWQIGGPAGIGAASELLDLGYDPELRSVLSSTVHVLPLWVPSCFQQQAGWQVVCKCPVMDWNPIESGFMTRSDSNRDPKHVSISSLAH